MLPHHEALFQEINSKFGLSETDFADTYDAKQWRHDASGSMGIASWFAEASPKYLTGVSKNAQGNSDGSEECTLNVWMGPSYKIPNMMLTFGKQNDGSHYVCADYVTRGPDPLDIDPRYMEDFYGPGVIAQWDEANTRPGATSLAPSTEFMERLLYSPGRIAVGGLSYEDAAGIASRHVSTFLGWIDTAEPIPARLRGSFNMRDDKLRQFFYRAEVVKRCNALGPDMGMTVAAVNTGPTAEAYVGGGS